MKKVFFVIFDTMSLTKHRNTIYHMLKLFTLIGNWSHVAGFNQLECLISAYVNSYPMINLFMILAYSESSTLNVCLIQNWLTCGSMLWSNYGHTVRLCDCNIFRKVCLPLEFYFTTAKIVLHYWPMGSDSIPELVLLFRLLSDN